MKEPIGTVTGTYDSDKGYATVETVILPADAATYLQEGDILTFNDVPYRIVSKKSEGGKASFQLKEQPPS